VTRSVGFVVPDSVDDPARPSGGNVYDRRVCDGLGELGWSVRVVPVPGAWPLPTPGDEAGLAAALDAMPAGDRVLVDGLVASTVPGLVVRHAARLRLVVLVHLPLGVLNEGRRASEAAMLRSVAGVVATSSWTRAWLVDEYGLTEESVTVAVPGTEPGGLADGTAAGGELLCVGAVTPVKGQDRLVEALALVDVPGWHCTCVGSLERDPGFVRALEHRARETGVVARLALAGPLLGTALDAAYRAADVLVVPSRAETYGMVVTEALAHGVPVIAGLTGGVPEALGTASDGAAPGLLVAADDVPALATALSEWLSDADLRERLRRAARDRRRTLPTWDEAALRVGAALGGA
jgi:glycosyltransferase involved in cell wall biosynthesis